MAVNKVMDSIGNLLIDLTGDTVAADKVLQGYTFHDRAGNVQVGTVQTTHSGVVSNYDEDNVVRFIDYDGTIIAEYSIDEAHALTELPTPPTPTYVDFLVFDGWNHTLEEVQTTTHSLLVGALYDTIDHKAHLKLNIVGGNAQSMRFYIQAKTGGDTVTVDWGDGTSDIFTATTGGAWTSYHQYPTGYASYWIIIDTTSNNLSEMYPGSGGTLNNFFSEMYIGSNADGVYNKGSYISSVKVITYASSITRTCGLSYNFGLRVHIYPRNCKLPQDGILWQCQFLQYVSFPRIVNSEYSSFNLSNSQIGANWSLKNFILPENSKVTHYSYIFYIPRICDYFYVPSITTHFYCSSKNIKKLYVPTSTISDYNVTIYDMLALEEIYFPDNVKTLILYNCGAESITVPNSVTTLTLGFSPYNNGAYTGTKLKYLDLSTFETPPQLTSTLLSGIFKIKVMPGTLSLYAAATNWSTLYAAGLIEETTE